MMALDTLLVNSIGGPEAVKIVIIIVLGLVLGWFSKYFIKKVAKSVIYPGVRKESPKSYKRTVSGVNLSAEIVQWAIVLVFIFQALSVLNISLFGEILGNAAVFIPKFAVATIVFIIGLLITGILSRNIENSDIIGSSIFSKVFTVVFISATILSALEIVGIRLTPFLYVFISGLFGIVFAVALAVGIGMGLALKPEITKIINSFKKK
jgi:hypothetical protein